jgi:hypothetical protein
VENPKEVQVDKKLVRLKLNMVPPDHSLAMHEHCPAGCTRSHIASCRHTIAIGCKTTMAFQYVTQDMLLCQKGIRLEGTQQICLSIPWTESMTPLPHTYKSWSAIASYNFAVLQDKFESCTEIVNG